MSTHPCAPEPRAPRPTPPMPNPLPGEPGYDPALPTPASPGSAEKLQVLEDRAAMKLPLFLRHDGSDNWPPPGPPQEVGPDLPRSRGCIRKRRGRYLARLPEGDGWRRLGWYGTREEAEAAVRRAA